MIGGGPAGSAAAITLARAGRPVIVLERNAVPSDPVCGDFLSGEAASAVVALGVDLAALSPEPIGRLRIVANNSIAATSLPFPAWGVSRRRLDAALLERAAECGATVLRGHAARGITRSGAVDAGDGGVLDASAVLLATGKHELRGMARTGARVESADLVGFKTYYRLAPAQAEALNGHIEIVLFGGGYAGLQPVEGGQATLCLLVSRAALREAGGGWDSLLAHLHETAPHLARRLTGARALRARPVAIASIPYGFVHKPSTPPPAGRVFRLGDQVGVIPSLAGDGVAIALHTGRLVASAVLKGADPAGYHRRVASDLAGQIGRAMLAHGLARRAAVQPALVAACRACPSLMRIMAARTRVRADAAWRSGPG